MTEGAGARFWRETSSDGKASSGRERPKEGGVKGETSPVRLPRPGDDAGPGIWNVISRRRSVRRYPARPMTADDLSRILHSSQGVTLPRKGACGLRAAPSAGARFPLETRVVVNSVEGIPPGLYRYLPDAHSLELEREGELGGEVASAAFDQEMCADASAVLVWTAVFDRTCSRYKERGYRYVLLDAGHAAHGAALAAVALGLGSCQIAAYYDDAMNRFVRVDGATEAVVYMTSVG